MKTAEFKNDGRTVGNRKGNLVLFGVYFGRYTERQRSDDRSLKRGGPARRLNDDFRRRGVGLPRRKARQFRLIERTLIARLYPVERDRAL